MIFSQEILPVSMYTETQEKKLLLKQFQPPTFKGEGTEVEKLAETWIEQLDDYFNEAGTAQVNRPSNVWDVSRRGEIVVEAVLQR